MHLDEKINQKQAAELLGISMARMSELCRDGWIKRDANGKVTPRVTFIGYIASIKEGRSTVDIDLKVLKGKDYQQRMDARAGKFQTIANREAYDLCMEAWPPVVAFIDGLPAMFSRDNEVRARVHKAIDQFKTKFVAHIKTLQT